MLLTKPDQIRDDLEFRICFRVDGKVTKGPRTYETLAQAQENAKSMNERINLSDFDDLWIEDREGERYERRDSSDISPG